MGSEHSHSAARFQSNAGSKHRARDLQSARSASPGPSISSDSDIPYVPYTINRPIGDSPKLPSRSPTHGLRISATPSPRSSPKAPRPKSYAGSTSKHGIIVVKEGALPLDTFETDCELMKLQTIPTFQPIMRGALSMPTIRDPEILNKLKHESVLKLCQRYQEHLRECSEVVSSEQNNITARIHEIDFAITTLMNCLAERQKKFIKYSERLGKVQEILKQLTCCETRLSEVITSMDSLNNLLPSEDQLEPFVMVTG